MYLSIIFPSQEAVFLEMFGHDTSVDNFWLSPYDASHKERETWQLQWTDKACLALCIRELIYHKQLGNKPTTQNG